MQLNTFAKYTTIENILKGGYGKQNVRVLGILSHIDPQNHLWTLESQNNKIDVEVPDELSNMAVQGTYVQVYGTVILGSLNPRIFAKFATKMNGVDEAAYNFAVEMYRKYMPSQCA